MPVSLGVGESSKVVRSEKCQSADICDVEMLPRVAFQQLKGKRDLLHSGRGCLGLGVQDSGFGVWVLQDLFGLYGDGLHQMSLGQVLQGCKA